MDSLELLYRRRGFLKSTAAALTALAAGPLLAEIAAGNTPLKKAIPVSGEMLPVIGMGTSRTFDVADQALRLKLLPVMEAFFSGGGTLIDSSPMYGASEETLGVLLSRLETPANLFSATKVWIHGRDEGIRQMENSLKLWGLESFDLMQIHNLRDWQVHLPVLREWKAAGRIRYIGITTSHNRYHEELAGILKKEALDFVQFSYNIANRTSEQSLLPVALDRGIAVLVNRPFQRGSLFQQVRGRDVPGFARELGINSWGQYFLKYAVSHPAVTCAIPATSKPKHALDNMGAGIGELPDMQTRQRMRAHFESL